MFKTYRIIPIVFILFLFGFTLITVSPVIADQSDDIEELNVCIEMQKQGGTSKYPYKPRMNCFADLAEKVIYRDTWANPPDKKDKELSVHEAAQKYCKSFSESKQTFNHGQPKTCVFIYMQGWLGVERE